MGFLDFWSGHQNRRGSDLVVRDIQGQLDYDMGKRIGARRGRPSTTPDTDRWGESAPFFKLSLLLAALGAIGGFGYGLWQPFTDHASPGLAADAVTVIEWTAIGAGTGALVPSALIVACALALIAGIFLGLGHLLNFLTSL